MTTTTSLDSIDVKKLPLPSLSSSKEYYRIVLAQNKPIEISVYSDLGLIHAIHTLIQLIHPTTSHCFLLETNIAWIEDSPRFVHRGLLIDVARSLFSLDFLQHVVDVLAMLKMNVLHLHLTDDQGFNIESIQFPFLHKQGASWLGYMREFHRLPPNRPRFYTQKALSLLKTYAARRGIALLLEIDIPGHARSWGPSLVSHCPRFLQKQKDNTLNDTLAIFSDTNIRLPLSPNTTTIQVIHRLIDEFRRAHLTTLSEPRLLSMGDATQWIHLGGDEVEQQCWQEAAANITLEKFYQRFFDANNPFFDQHQWHTLFWEEAITPLSKVNIPTALSQLTIQLWTGPDAFFQFKEKLSSASALISWPWYLDPTAPNRCKTWQDCYCAASAMPMLSSSHVNGGEACAWELSEHTLNHSSFPLWQSFHKNNMALSDFKEKQRHSSISKHPERFQFDVQVWFRLVAIAERLWTQEKHIDVEKAPPRLKHILQMLNKSQPQQFNKQQSDQVIISCDRKYRRWKRDDKNRKKKQKSRREKQTLRKQQPNA